jgi:enoyl-CoA hydratase/carnithine racemase
MLLTGLPTDADWALQAGLVVSVHEPDALMPAALDLAERVASRAPLAVEATKTMANQALDVSVAEALHCRRVNSRPSGKRGSRRSRGSLQGAARTSVRAPLRMNSLGRWLAVMRCLRR